MSLNYNLKDIPLEVRTKIAEYDDPFNGVKKGDRVTAPVTHGLIFATMVIGIGIINDDTLDEWEARIKLYGKVHGGLFTEWVGTVTKDGQCGEGEWVSRDFTREELEAHKGLSTNVFPLETRTKWVKRMITDNYEVFPKPAPKTR